MCICVYTYVYMYVYICVYVCIHMCISSYVFVVHSALVVLSQFSNLNISLEISIYDDAEQAAGGASSVI